MHCVWQIKAPTKVWKTVPFPYFLITDLLSRNGTEKSKWRTDWWMNEDIVILIWCVRPSVWRFSSLLPLYASSNILFHIIVLNFRYSCISDFIFEYLMIIVWECQNSRLSECAVSWTLHFHPNSIFWYSRGALFSFCYEYQKLTILPTYYHLFCCLVGWWRHCPDDSRL